MGYKNVRRWSYSGTNGHLPTFFLQSNPMWPTDLWKKMLISLGGFMFQGARTYQPFFLAMKPNAAD